MMRKPALALFVPALLFLGLLVLPSPGQAVTNPANRRVASSTDATAVSVAVSKEFFPTAKSLDTVVVARGDVFADNLNGSALAGAVKGALLLTDGGSTAALRPEVLTEIKRVLKSPSGCNTAADTDVFILGGTAAVSGTAEAAIKAAGWCVARLGGANRIATALSIANTIRQRSGTTDNAFVARSDNPADSASGGALAGRNGIPIAVNPTAALDGSVSTFLFGKAPFNKLVTLLGGPAALSAGVENSLNTMATSTNSGTKIDRLSGSARDGTAAQIAERYRQTETGAGRSAGAVNVIIVNGYAADGWVYALTGGAVAWQENVVVLYVQTDSVPSETCKYLEKYKPGTVITLGPTSRVSDATKTAAQAVAGGMKTCAQIAPTTTTTTTVPSTQSADEKAVLDLVNAERTQRGLAPLVFDARLREAALIHANDQKNQDCFTQLSHTGTDGSEPWDRVDRTGLTWAGVAENIACGQQTPAEVMNSWMNSPGHRANILDPTMTALGVSRTTNSAGTPYWVQVFAIPTN